MAVYERYSGQHVAERVKTADGTEDGQRLEALAADGTDGWRRVDAPKRTKKKAE
jgi:hypothetical protein